MFNWKLLFKNLGLMALSLLIGGVVMATDDKEDFIPIEVMPEIIKQIEPEYPMKAKKEGVECELWVKAYVDTLGNVAKAEIAKIPKEGEGYGFAEAALEAAKQCQFKPGLQKGKPVATWVTYKVVFKLDDCKENSK